MVWAYIMIWYLDFCLKYSILNSVFLCKSWKVDLRVDLYLGFPVSLLWTYSSKILRRAIVQLKMEILWGTSWVSVEGFLKGSLNGHLNLSILRKGFLQSYILLHIYSKTMFPDSTVDLILPWGTYFWESLGRD